MNKIVGLKLGSLAVIFAASLSGCSSKPVKMEPVPIPAQYAAEEKTVIKGAPDWVNRGSTIAVKAGGRVLQGVGRAEAVGDLAQQKSMADDKARSEVSKLLDQYLLELGNDYKVQSGTAENIDVLQELRSGIRQDLAATRITASWRDPATNVIWSIAELDIRNIKSAMSNTADLNPDIKQFIELSADKIFDRLVNGRK